MYPIFYFPSAFHLRLLSSFLFVCSVFPSHWCFFMELAVFGCTIYHPANKESFLAVRHNTFPFQETKFSCISSRFSTISTSKTHTHTQPYSTSSHFSVPLQDLPQCSVFHYCYHRLLCFSKILRHFSAFYFWYPIPAKLSLFSSSTVKKFSRPWLILI